MGKKGTTKQACKRRIFAGHIKGILWGWSGDASKRYGGATYPTAAAFAAGACPDVSADGMIAICKDVSTDFSRIVPGAAVWVKGHIGVYIGDGLAVECTPKWRNKVQVTAVSNIGTKAGYNARKWTKWGKIPYISYEEEIENMSKEELKALIRETVKEVLDEENPVYKDLKDVPECWKQTAAAILDAGAVNGGTPAEVCATDLNLRMETLKAVVVAAMYECYIPDIAQAAYEATFSGKGPRIKIGHDHKLANYLGEVLKDGYRSPEAALGEIKVKGMEFDT